MTFLLVSIFKIAKIEFRETWLCIVVKLSILKKMGVDERFESGDVCVTGLVMFMLEVMDCKV